MFGTESLQLYQCSTSDKQRQFSVQLLQKHNGASTPSDLAVQRLCEYHPDGWIGIGYEARQLCFAGSTVGF